MNDTISVWVLGDQLLRAHPGIAAAEERAPRDRIRVVLVESDARIAQRPYQHKKLVLLLSAMRHYAARLRRLGYVVDERRAPSFLDGLRAHAAEHRPAALLAMAASEYDTRRFQERDLAGSLGLPVELLPNTQFLVGRHDPFPGAPVGRRYVMERFYRSMRQQFGLLLEADGDPSGGAWNFDRLNRRPLPRGARPPRPLAFEPDAITREVIAEVAGRPGVGTAEDFRLAVTHEQAEQALADFVANRLGLFGPYEDAMSTEHETLYHSALSPYVNIGLLEPLQMARAAEAAFRSGAAPIQSVEGFVRQVIGWREFIYWQYWRQMPELRERNHWGMRRRLPRFFWEGETDMRCLRLTVERAVRTGYTHHIERLMLVCNFCLLAGVQPQEVNDWFLAHFVDAYDWVMQPNVIGMGLNADGGVTATKPYIASASYIRRMGDYCAGCRYDPKRRTGEGACPFNTLYWSFLLEHEAALRANPRLGPAVLGLGRIGPSERAAIRRDAERFLATLDPVERAGEGE